MTTRYMLTIAYDGTNFSGWQIQPNSVSIQETVQQALYTITGEHPCINASGRTDAGVHARAQVAHVDLDTDKTPLQLLRSLNGLLPYDIRVLDIKEVSQEFHARKSAIKKEYHYHLCLDEVALPFDRPYVWHCRYKLDLDLLRQAAALFVGPHNFKACANERGKNCRPNSFVRTIYRLDVIETPIGVRLEFEGNGFLYKMVRNITSILVHVASGRYPLNFIPELLKSEDRRNAPRVAPAQGLFLMKVSYP